ncbi:hypothetical protein [Streptomyces sp. NPDC088915]|uniref:hypothetical protein n=1 Tax=Streptomyces sp. NPDC088915 TaxID=3365912 RepID=UPI003804DA92
MSPRESPTVRAPTADPDATRRLESVDATSATQSDRSVERVGDAYRSQVKVSGTFRQEFDLSEYPFDITVLGARFGLLGASLFGVVLSMRAVSLTGTSFGVTLVDQIHLATLLHTLVGVGCTSCVLYRWADPEAQTPVRRTNTAVAVATTAAYLIANAVSTGLAVT